MTTNKNQNPRTHKSETLARFAKRGNTDQGAAVKARMMLASRIYDAMKGKSWTQKVFAGEMGKQESEISKWLSGHHNFTVDTLVSIERKLGIYLIHRTDEMPKEVVIEYMPVLMHATVGASGATAQKAPKDQPKDWSFVYPVAVSCSEINNYKNTSKYSNA